MGKIVQNFNYFLCIMRYYALHTFMSKMCVIYATMQYFLWSRIEPTLRATRESRWRWSWDGCSGRSGGSEPTTPSWSWSREDWSALIPTSRHLQLKQSIIKAASKGNVLGGGTIAPWPKPLLQTLY